MPLDLVVPRMGLEACSGKIGRRAVVSSRAIISLNGKARCSHGRDWKQVGIGGS